MLHAEPDFGGPFFANGSKSKCHSLELFRAASSSVLCSYRYVGTQSNILRVAIVVEHCCPTGPFLPEYIILIDYTTSPLNLNDLQKESTKSWSCDFLCTPRFLWSIIMSLTSMNKKLERLLTWAWMSYLFFKFPDRLCIR